MYAPGEQHVDFVEFRTIQSQGFHLTLDYLGESVRTLEEADAATREYVRLLDVLVASGIERNISLKLTQLGLDVDKASTVDNLRKILEHAQPMAGHESPRTTKLYDRTKD